MGLAKEEVGGGEGRVEALPYRFTGKMAKHVCSCHGTRCFQRNSRSSRGAEGVGSGRKEDRGRREKKMQ